MLKNCCRSRASSCSDHDLCEVFPADSTGELFEKYRSVVLSGKPLYEDLVLHLDDGGERWLRRRIHKLDDGVAVTVSDVTEVKETEERYRSLSNFSNSVFETAPFSIIETDLNGMVRAMNKASEKLTGYTRAEMVGKVAITMLHDPTELAPQPAKTPRRMARRWRASPCLRPRPHRERSMRRTGRTCSGTARRCRCMSR